MSTWRTAYSIITLIAEVNAYRPDRDKKSDGTIGDADHRNRNSDHNPWVPDPEGKKDGVVTAVDFTDDRNTLTMEVGEHLRVRRDRRVKYFIGERRMFSSYPTSRYPAWAWRPYDGINAHTSHCHLSVQPQPHLFDSRAPWGLARPEDGQMEQLVRDLQRALNEAGRDAGDVDGVFGPRTYAALVESFRPAPRLNLSGEAQRFWEDTFRDLKAKDARSTSLGHLLDHHRAARDAWPDQVKPGP